MSILHATRVNDFAKALHDHGLTAVRLSKDNKASMYPTAPEVTVGVADIAVRRGQWDGISDLPNWLNPRDDDIVIMLLFCTAVVLFVLFIQSL